MYILNVPLKLSFFFTFLSPPKFLHRLLVSLNLSKVKAA